MPSVFDSERPVTLETERLLLVVLLPHELETLVAGDAEGAATVASDNVASQRLAAKLGMTLPSDTRRSLPLWKLKTA